MADVKLLLKQLRLFEVLGAAKGKRAKTEDKDKMLYLLLYKEQHSTEAVNI